jgi:hypothetical protein
LIPRYSLVTGDLIFIAVVRVELIYLGCHVMQLYHSG